MGFSKEWNDTYASNAHLSIWPWSDVVSLVHRHCKRTLAAGGAVLEVGCGAGANIPLFLSLGLDYYGLEGSPVIVDQLHTRFPDLRSAIVCADFTEEIPLERSFDIIVDRAALTHNDSSAIARALKEIREKMTPGGTFIGVDWFSSNHSDAALGEPVDAHTRTMLPRGQFTGVGKVHFSDEHHLRQLFRDFELIYLEEKIHRCFEPGTGHQFASWNVVARCPE